MERKSECGRASAQGRHHAAGAPGHSARWSKQGQPSAQVCAQPAAPRCETAYQGAGVGLGRGGAGSWAGASATTFAECATHEKQQGSVRTFSRRQLDAAGGCQGPVRTHADGTGSRACEPTRFFHALGPRHSTVGSAGHSQPLQPLQPSPSRSHWQCIAAHTQTDA